MKKEHHKFVADFFNKESLIVPNFFWTDDFSIIQVSQLVVSECGSRFCIIDALTDYCIYGGIVGEEAAIQVLHLIEDTEVLFI